MDKKNHKAEIVKLKNERDALIGQAKAITDAAKKEDRDLTQKEIDTQADLIKQINAKVQAIENAQALEDLEQSAAVVTTEEGNGEKPGANVSMIKDAEDKKDPKQGFQTFGEFSMAVVKAVQGNVIDNRLTTKSNVTDIHGATMNQESSGGDGGYLVPIEFSNEIYRHMMLAGSNLLDLTMKIPVMGNNMTLPTDETTPWSSTGVQAYWSAEGANLTVSAGQANQKTLRLHKLHALARVTDELLADVSALDAWITRGAAEAMIWKINDSLVNGSGVGQPQGILNAKAKITITAESGQAADSIVVDNIGKMFAQSLNPARSIWMGNSTIIPQLIKLNVGDQPTWVKPGTGLQDGLGGSLLGRPLMLTETCHQLGDEGDLIFVDWMSYLTLVKRNMMGIQSDMSIHLWFDRDETAFRFIFRVDGRPWFDEPVTPPHSALKKSCYITLAERA